MGDGCKDTCKKCEKPKILQEDREKHFKELWALGSSAARYDYLSRLMISYEPKSRNTLPDRAKKHIKVYRLKNSEGKMQKVCKPMFLQTFGINHSVSETAFKKAMLKGSITPEKRGRSEPKNKTTEAQKRSVRRHIEQIQRVPSHYCRVRTRKEYYFEASLNFERLFKLYCEWVVDTGLPSEEKATKSMYREIFMTECNIGFNEPLSDQCVIHARWRNGTREEREEMFEEYECHLSWYNYIKKTKAQEKEYASTDEGADFCLGCFDLQKVLTLPRSSISVMFYLRKLSLYNFTVFELFSNRGYCFLWNETIAHRGANEVASCLMKFVEKMASQGKKRFSLYSDSPSGQNRNRMVFALWLYLAVKHGVSLTHRFFESGHSFSEVDSIHGNIETESRDKEIFHPDQWVQQIMNAKQNGESYDIDHLTTETCLDFHQFVNELYWEKDTDRETVKWSTVKQVS